MLKSVSEITDSLAVKMEVSRIDRFVLGVFLFMVIYLSYRYPFQINSSDTSPTYSDTPLPLQLGKYLAAVLFCMISTLVPIGKRVFGKLGSKVAVVLIALSAPDFIRSLVSTNTLFVEPAFWLVVSYVMAIRLKRFSVEIMDKILSFLFLYALTFELIQISLFILYQRLPALAYEDSISVRFGSFLDDPNGFSILCFLFMGWALQNTRNWVSLLATLASIVLIVLTQSLTGIILMVAIFSLYLILSRPTLRKYSILAVLLVAIVVAVAGRVPDVIDVVEDFLSTKQASIAEHTTFDTSPIQDSLAISLIFGSIDYFSHESWWYRSSINSGAIITGAVFFVHCYLIFSVFKAYRLSVGVVRKRVCFATFFFGVAYMLGSFNLPLPAVFPLNLIFYFLSFAVLNSVDDSEEAFRHKSAES